VIASTAKEFKADAIARCLRKQGGRITFRVDDDNIDFLAEKIVGARSVTSAINKILSKEQEKAVERGVFQIPGTRIVIVDKE